MADPLQVLRETPVEELRQGVRSKEKRQVLREFIPRYLERKATKREIWAFMDADMWRPEDPEDVSSWGGNPSELEQFSQHLHKLPPNVLHSYIRQAEEQDNPDLAYAFRAVLDTQETDDEGIDVGGRRRGLTPRRKRTLKKTTRKTRKQKRRN